MLLVVPTVFIHHLKCPKLPQCHGVTSDKLLLQTHLFIWVSDKTCIIMPAAVTIWWKITNHASLNVISSRKNNG